MGRRLVASIVAWGLVSAAAGLGCTGSGSDPACTATVDVDLVATPEMAPLLEDLAGSFNRSDAARAGSADTGAGTGAICARVVVHPLSAHRADVFLGDDWRGAPDDLPAPVLWAPGASTWSILLDQRRAAAGRPVVATDATPIARTPLVVALPRSRAEVLGWPDRPIRLEDLQRLAAADLSAPCGPDDAPAGMRVLVAQWCTEGWGPFRLGRASPDLAVSGLSALVLQAYAATGKTDTLQLDDLDDRWVTRFVDAGEAAVARYGDDPRRFLGDLYRADVDERPAPDPVAVVVEEKAVIDYNRGDPAGTGGLDGNGGGEAERRPADRLVALYPAEGTVEADGPLILLDVPWADAAERAAARRFVTYARSGEVQPRVLDFGYRPVQPGIDVEAAGPLFSRSGYGVEAEPVVPALAVPDAAVLDALRAQWHERRQRARVLLVVDVSGSMGDPTDIRRAGSPTKLDLVKRALTAVLDRFGDDDEVGLWVFSTALTGPGTLAGGQVRERVAPRPMGPADAPRGQRRRLTNAIGALRPRNDTALHAAIARAHAAVVAEDDPDRIDAVVLLTDGHDEVEGPPGTSADELDALLDELARDGGDRSAVPVLTVAYGGDADVDVLRAIAEATGGAFHDSTDPATIELVLGEAVGSL